MAGKPRPSGRLYGEMLTLRVSPEQRIELSKLAHKRRQSVSDVLRTLIAQATATQKAMKGAPSGATPTNEVAA